MSGREFQKGHKNVGGRKPGSKNKLDADAKVLLDKLIDYGLDHAESWLAKTAAKNPGRALEMLSKMLEYRVPKLAKTEVGVNGQVDVVVERRIYGEAPTVEVLTAGDTSKLLPAADAVDAEEID